MKEVKWEKMREDETDFSVEKGKRNDVDQKKVA